jgi:hypothetical protein
MSTKKGNPLSKLESTYPSKLLSLLSFLKVLSPFLSTQSFLFLKHKQNEQVQEFDEHSAQQKELSPCHCIYGNKSVDIFYVFGKRPAEMVPIYCKGYSGWQ